VDVSVGDRVCASADASADADATEVAVVSAPWSPVAFGPAATGVEGGGAAADAEFADDADGSDVGGEGRSAIIGAAALDAAVCVGAAAGEEPTPTAGDTDRPDGICADAGVGAGVAAADADAAGASFAAVNRAAKAVSPSTGPSPSVA